MRRELKRVLLRLGLYGWLWEIRGRLRGLAPRTLYRNWRWRRRHDTPDPIPPPRLIHEVVHHYDIEVFLTEGADRARAIEDNLAEAGFDLSSCRSGLDFGCGCGRIIRHLKDRAPARWYGSDINPRLIGWCQDNLKFGRFTTNGLAPPLAYDDGAFDLIYAISVLTHLDEDLQNRWLTELHRVLSPDGALLVTTHGDSCFDGLDDDEARRYREGSIVVRSAQAPGSNLCETYHPPEYFRRIAGTLFAQIHHAPQGEAGRRAQDIWVLRSPLPQ